MTTASELIKRAKEVRARLWSGIPTNPHQEEEKEVESPPSIPREVTPQEVMHAVANYYGIGISDITGYSRRFNVLRARQVAMYLSCKNTKTSTAQLGRIFNRDHSTIIHGRDLIDGFIKSGSVDYRAITDQIMDELWRVF
jgi:chromosomal replication initiation ATPase DnaA